MDGADFWGNVFQTFPVISQKPPQKSYALPIFRLLAASGILYLSRASLSKSIFWGAPTSKLAIKRDFPARRLQTASRYLPRASLCFPALAIVASLISSLLFLQNFETPRHCIDYVYLGGREAPRHWHYSRLILVIKTLLTDRRQAGSQSNTSKSPLIIIPPPYTPSPLVSIPRAPI
jgi:hypothetical protein